MKKWLAMILILLMCLSLLPVAVLADEADPFTVSIGASFMGDFLWGAGSDYNYMVGNCVYDYLFKYDREAKKNTSDVLEDWYYEDDTTFVMTMMEGITFADGNAMTGEDIIFSLQSYVLNEANSYANLVAYVDFENCTVVENVVTIKFTAPNSAGLFGEHFPIYEKAWVEEKGWDSNEWMTAPMGSGPYEVTEYVTDSYLILSLRDDYWGDPAGLPDEIKLSLYHEVSVEFIDLESGVLDVAANISPEDYVRAQSEDGITAVNIGDGANMFFTLNQTKNSYLQNIKVREAIAKAIDWNAVATLAVGEGFAPGTSIINSNSEYYTPIGSYEYDPDAAKQILADEGIAEGEIVLSYMGPELESQKVMAEAIQYYLQQVGIVLDLQFCDGGVFIPAWIAGECDTLFNTNGSGSPNADPTSYLRDYLLTANFVSTSVNDPTFDEMYDAAATCVDPVRGKELWTELAQYSYDNYLLLVVNENMAAIAYNDETVAGMNVCSANAPNVRNIEWIH